MTRLVVSRRAKRDLENLAADIRDAVEAALTRLAADPEEAGKKLRGRLAGRWVCRIGSYRILYRLEGEAPSQRVIVLTIRHRADAYRRRRGR